MSESNSNSALEAGSSGTPAGRKRTQSTRLSDSVVTPQTSKKGTGAKLGPGHGAAGGSAPHKRKGSACKPNGTPNLERYAVPDERAIELKRAQGEARQVNGLSGLHPWGTRVVSEHPSDRTDDTRHGH